MAANSRIVREKIYNAFQCKPPFLVCNNKRALGLDGVVPSEADREKNFKLLVEQNFSGTGILGMESRDWPVEKRKDNVRAFAFFHKYALTPYGGVMVTRILADNRTHTTAENRFSIGIQDHNQATGGHNFVSLPSNFPTLTTFPGSTQLVDPLAVIHHEFGHTRFDARNSGPHEISLEDERQVVIYHENPVRMMNGMEPRYTYTNTHTSTEGRVVMVTINIITGEKKPDLYTFSPSNPAILVKP